ncbi:MAG: co-chaperone GroES [Alphaproteobacteria bacterium]|nr:co-chaperone GroES [Alphaproteobacteria bacterium]
MNVKEIIPLYDKILVRRITTEEKSAGGILIPDTAKEKPLQGEVLSVGPGSVNEQGDQTPLCVKAGDIVLFAKWSGTEITVNAEELLVMKESDVLAIIKK